jgi:hypothetical protein
VIRVYDDVGNVIETHEHKGRVQRVVIAIKQEREQDVRHRNRKDSLGPTCTKSIVTVDKVGAK